MNKLFSTILCFLVSSSLYSQVKLSGTVRDNTGKPIDAANVIAVNQASKAIESFFITDVKGQYKLNLVKKTGYKLTVSYMGMKTMEIGINTQELDVIQDFILLPDSRFLEELKINYRVPLKINGDTMTYDAESFRNASDRKLEDVLKRLPGVEVTKEGEIKVEGKIVREIKVDGAMFFDGSTKLASKNIPAGVLDKIQVLKNEDNVRQLKEVRDNSENVSINIKLKEGKKNFWFGDMAAGSGPKERYILYPKLFYYSSKRSANVILNMNNIGDAPLSSSELDRFSVSQNEIHQKSGTGFNVESAAISLSMRNKMAQSTKNKFAAANLNYSPTPVWNLMIYGIYSGSKILTQEYALKQFIETESGPGQRVDESTSSQNYQYKNLGLFKINSIFTPNKNSRLDYTAFSSFGRQHIYKDFYSSVLEEIGEQNWENPYKISQAMNYYYTLNEENVFAFESQYLAQSQDAFYNALILRPDLFRLAENLGLNETQSNYNLNQKKQVKTNKFDVTLNYWKVINRISNINFTLGILLSKQRFNSEIYQILDNETMFNPQSARGKIFNDIIYDFKDIYLGLRYRLKAGVFVFEPASSLHTYQTRNSQFSGATNQQFYSLLPSFDVKAQLKSTEAIQFTYKKMTRFTDVNNLAEGIVLNDYNSLFLGNRDLKNTLSHNFNLNYYSRLNQISRYRFTNLNARINYNKSIDAIRNRIDPEGILQVGLPFNSNFSDETASANASVSQALWRMVVGVSGTISLSRYNQIFAGTISLNEVFTQNYNFNLRTNFSEKVPSASAGYDLMINRYTLGSTNPTFFTDRIYFNATASFLRGFKLTTEYEFNNYRNERRSLNSYSFLNTDFTYQKPNSQWEYMLRGMNVLNTESFNQDSANEFYTISSQYMIQPMYLIVSIKYHL